MSLKSPSSSEDVKRFFLPDIERRNSSDLIVALAGNPNVGKSTVFNALTGMRQHTGNWPGKTVEWASGTYTYNGHENILVDTPGAYSLFPGSAEEEVTRDFITSGVADVTVIVCDASCLERNLNLVLQILSFTRKAVVCVNLIDEAAKKGIYADADKLGQLLGVPVVATSARSGKGLDALMQKIEDAALKNPKGGNSGDCSAGGGYTYGDSNAYNGDGACKSSGAEQDGFVCENVSCRTCPCADSNSCGGACPCKDANSCGRVCSCGNGCSRGIGIPDFTRLDRRQAASNIFHTAESICAEVVHRSPRPAEDLQLKIDRLLTRKSTGIPVMLLLLALVFYITMAGANIPSEILASTFSTIGGWLDSWLLSVSCPETLRSLLVSGIYRTVSWVVSFMLPPMAIFFPLFTLLEDLGYLPRVAFNLDNAFRRCGACGKQSLTMCMGFGCNAAGVVGCRIIESPRERLVAIITNSFVPCNGRFPTLIALITIFFAGAYAYASATAAVILTGFILLGVVMTLIVSKLLSSSVLKGLPSSTALEMPPFRRPQIGRVIVRSVFDRTLFVLGRAVVTAAPAGLIIWLMANVRVNDASVLSYCTDFLDPFARIFGLDGVILTAFILALPANEILIPIIIMAYTASGSLTDYDSLDYLRELLTANGWTALTALNTMLFSLMHWPCATTLLTIKKETGSLKWTLVSFLTPAVCGLAICFITATLYRAVF